AGVDGSPALWRDETREAYLLFSEPYLENRLVLVARKGKNVSATSLSALAGKKVGIVQDYAYGQALSEAKGVEFVEQESTSANLQSLMDGGVDYVLIDELLIDL